MHNTHRRAPSSNSGWLQRLWQQGRDALARQRADRRLWQAARADHRVMIDCLQAGGRDLHDAAGLADATAAHWGRFPEQLPDGRGPSTHLRHG